MKINNINIINKNNDIIIDKTKINLNKIIKDKEVSLSKIEKIKEAIEKKEYNIDIDKIANAMTKWLLK